MVAGRPGLRLTSEQIGVAARAGCRSRTTRNSVLVMGRARGYKRFDKAGTRLGHEVNYYAHTAVRLDGAPDQNLANWQLLSMHLRGVNYLAKEPAPGYAGPFHPETRDRESENHGLPTMLRTVFDGAQNGLKGNQELA